MSVRPLEFPHRRQTLVRPSRATLAASCAATGMVLVVASDAMPWLTLFHGMSPIAGFRLGGGDLTGLAIAALALLLIAGRHGGARVLKPAAVVLAGFVVIGAVSIALNIGSYVRSPGSAAALSAPTAGPGPFILAAGGVAILLAVLTATISRRRLTPTLRLPLMLAASTFVAGWMHLLLTPEHLSVARVLGLGFLLSGVAQLALAVLAVERPSDLVWSLLVMLNIALMVVWAYAVLVGLPFASEEHGASAGLVVGSGEPIDLAAIITKAAELTGIAVALVLMRRPGPNTRDSSDVSESYAPVEGRSQDGVNCGIHSRSVPRHAKPQAGWDPVPLERWS